MEEWFERIYESSENLYWFICNTKGMSRSRILEMVSRNNSDRETSFKGEQSAGVKSDELVISHHHLWSEGRMINLQFCDWVLSDDCTDAQLGDYL